MAEIDEQVLQFIKESLKRVKLEDNKKLIAQCYVAITNAIRIDEKRRNNIKYCYGIINNVIKDYQEQEVLKLLDNSN